MKNRTKMKYNKQNKQNTHRNIRTLLARNKHLKHNVEKKFKKINNKTIKDLQKKFTLARQKLQYSRFLNRQQIGCSTSKNFMKGGTSSLTQLGYTIEDAVNNLKGNYFGTTIPAISDPTVQPLGTD